MVGRSVGRSVGRLGRPFSRRYEDMVLMGSRHLSSVSKEKKNFRFSFFSPYLDSIFLLPTFLGGAFFFFFQSCFNNFFIHFTIVLFFRERCCCLSPLLVAIFVVVFVFLSFPRQGRTSRRGKEEDEALRGFARHSGSEQPRIGT